jgi:orotate phosphoribosyltransferase
VGDDRVDLLEALRHKGLRYFEEPVRLASGEESHWFFDAKRALAGGSDLRAACLAMAAAAARLDVAYDAVGGLTMGADQFAHGIAVLTGCGWFVVRKQPKGRGTNQLVEGTPLGPGVRTLLVEDTVTTGGSIAQAFAAVTETGATVAAALTLVDRGDLAAGFFVDRGVPYHALYTYRDLAIEPVTVGGPEVRDAAG